MGMHRLGLSVFLACGNMPPAISVVNYTVAIYILYKVNVCLFLSMHSLRPVCLSSLCVYKSVCFTPTGRTLSRKVSILFLE